MTCFFIRIIVHGSVQEAPWGNAATLLLGHDIIEDDPWRREMLSKQRTRSISLSRSRTHVCSSSFHARSPRTSRACTVGLWRRQGRVEGVLRLAKCHMVVRVCNRSYVWAGQCNPSEETVLYFVLYFVLYLVQCVPLFTTNARLFISSPPT